MIAVLVVSGAAPAGAQEDAPRETFTGRAQVTAVDLVIDVRDADGRVPAGLGPEDFTVLEDGEEKQVVGVELLTGGTVAGSAAERAAPVAPAAEDARLDEATWSLVVYVDQVLSSTGSIRRASQMLAAQAGRLSALGAVEVVVADPRPRQLLPPTRSARLIEQTLLRLGRETGGRDAIRQIRRQYFEHLRRQLELAGRGQGSAAGGTGIDLGRTRLSTGRTTFTWEAVQQEHRLLVGQQDEMLTWLSGHLGEGPRALLLVNDGYDLDPRDFYTTGAESARIAAELNSTLQDYSSLDRFQEMTRSIAAEGWTCLNLAFGNPGATFATSGAEVDGKGRMGQIGGSIGELATELPSALAMRPLDPLRNLADETGGELLTGARAIPGALERLGERVRLTYQVARLPDGELHRVEVRPRDRTWKVKAPEWSGSAAPQAAASARARRLIAGGVEAGGLPLEAAVGIDQAAGDEESQTVRGTLQARLALRELTAALPPASTLRVTFAVELPGQSPYVRHDLIENQDLAGLDWWTYSVPVSMPPEAGKISVVVEELSTGVWGGALAARVAGPLPEVEEGRRTAAVAAGGGRGSTRTAEQLGFDVPVDLLPDPKAVLLVPPGGEMHTGRVRFETLATRPDVERVEFLLDGERVEVVGRAPFETRIDLGEVPRPRTVEAVALDAAGEELGRDSVVVNEGAGTFRVRLIEPRRTDRVGPVDVEAEVRLRDGDELDRVEIAWNNEPVATLYAPPFRQRVLVPPESPVGYVTVTAHLADGSSAEDVAFMNGPGGDERVEVQLVELFTVVTDPAGRPIRGLGAGDFQVAERGRRQRVEAVRDGAELPLSLGLMIDTSASMQDVLGEVAIAAIDFLYLALDEDDRSMLVSFDSQPRLIQPLTGDREAVGRSLVKLRPGGYTALCDALVFSLVQMQSVKGRRAMVLLSDGVGREERVGYATCLRLAQQVGIPIYAIILDRDGGERQRSEKMDDVVAAVGGRSFYVPGLENLGEVYRTIRQELESQYLVNYYPSDTAGDDWRPVDVEVLQPGLTARTVAGYWP